MLAPILQKYNPEGALLFERRLEGPEIDNLTRILVTDTPDKYISFGYDGLDARVIVLDPIVDHAYFLDYIAALDCSGSISHLSSGTPCNKNRSRRS
jgi:hypothetical protein